MSKLSDLTPIELQHVAELAGTSYAYLRHVAKGRRNASAETAASVEKAADHLGLDVGRETMCATCKGCRYLKAAKRQERQS